MMRDKGGATERHMGIIDDFLKKPPCLDACSHAKREEPASCARQNGRR
jgi:hypothetical protein